MNKTGRELALLNFLAAAALFVVPVSLVYFGALAVADWFFGGQYWSGPEIQTADALVPIIGLSLLSAGTLRLGESLGRRDAELDQTEESHPAEP